MHNLMGHMHLHSDSKPFKCLYCPSKFTLKGNLTRHMKVKHGVMERGFHSQGNIYEQSYTLRGLDMHISNLTWVFPTDLQSYIIDPMLL